MFDDLFERLISENRFEERILALYQGSSWEHVAFALYQVLEGREEAKFFRNKISKILVEKALFRELKKKVNESIGKIAPFGTEEQEIQAVLNGRKTVSRIVTDLYPAEKALKNPNLKSIKSGKSYTIFYLPKNEKEALSRAKEIEDIISDVDAHGSATREQMIRLGQLFDYSKEDINVFLEKVGYPIQEGLGKSIATAIATGILSVPSSIGVDKSIPISPEISYQKSIGFPTIDIDRLADIESAQNPRAVNKRTGARGLLQIMKPTWEEATEKLGVDWSWDEAFDPEKNEEVGTFYINVEIPRLLKHYGLEDTLENRLAAFNWGVGNLKRLGLDKAPKETKDYIHKYLGVEAKVEEATTSDMEHQLKHYYKNILNGPLRPAKNTGWTVSQEEDWLKFWLLSDGTIIPVEEQHGKTIEDAGLYYDPSSEMISGYIDLNVEGGNGYRSKELGLRGPDTKPNSKQMKTIKKLFNKYRINSLYVDMWDSFHANVDSEDKLEYLLTYGPEKAWESVKEVVATLSQDEEKVKKYYANKSKELKISTCLGEEWYKFWLLTDGTIIPVKYAHGEIFQNTGIRTFSGGTIRGAIIGKELNVHGLQKPNENQRATLVKIAIKYGTTKLVSEFGLAGTPEKKYWDSLIKSSDQLDYVLTYGPEEAWESVKENLIDHAKKELELAGLFDKDSDYNGALGKAAMELIHTFSTQGHSGCSAAFTAELFDKLANWKPLTELTDDPEEWDDLTKQFSVEDVKGMRWQNLRDPRCFSNDSGKTYFNVEDEEKKMYTSKSK